VAVGCGVNAVRGSIYKGSDYVVYVTNTTNTTIAQGTLMNWSLQSTTGNKSGGVYLPTALAPHASEIIAQSSLGNVPQPPRATCTAAIAATFTAPGYGSGSGGPSHPITHGQPPVHAQ
jgi:hypothetical protein